MEEELAQNNNDRDDKIKEEKIDENQINSEKEKNKESDRVEDEEEAQKKIQDGLINDLSSHESIFYDDESEEQKDNNNQQENNNNINNNNNENDLLNKIDFLGKKQKRELTEEQKEARIKRNIERYCKRNDEMIDLLKKINGNEATNKNINRMMQLLAIDLSDTKKLTNKKALISQRKKDIFKKLFLLTFSEYQEFWYKLTDGLYKKGNAQLIKSGNIAKARIMVC